MTHRKPIRRALVGGTMAAATFGALTLGAGAANAATIYGHDSNSGDGFSVAGWYYYSNEPYFVIQLCNNQSTTTDFDIKIVDRSTGHIEAQQYIGYITAGSCSYQLEYVVPDFGDPMSAYGSAGSGWIGTDPILPD